MARVGNCGTDFGVLCNVTYLEQQCDAHPLCNAFNTNGYLKSCPGGKLGALCGCDSGGEYCMRGQDIYAADGTEMFGCDHVDMYVLNGQMPPEAWQAGIEDMSLLYSSPEPNVCYMPEVGNGFLGTVVGFDALYVGGLFNGGCGSVHKARIPSPALYFVEGWQIESGALDMRQGLYVRRWVRGNNTLDQRIYAHRQRRHVLVTEFALTSMNSVDIHITSSFNPTHAGPHGPGSGCAGDFTDDFVFTQTFLNASVAQYDGRTTLKGDYGETYLVSIATSVLPSVQTLDPGATWVLLTTVAASVEFPGNASAADVHSLASAEYARATDAAGGLLAEHAAGWAALHQSGIEFAASIDVSPRAREIATHTNSSLYYLFSSIRDDWFAGVSPGGVATQNYQGAVFMDMDWWIEPTLALLSPPLARALLEYRFISLNSSAVIARTFGYSGAMYAWTAALQGRPFGCCSGHGSYEDCKDLLLLF